MKILRIKSCYDCKYYDSFYDTKLSLGRFVCKYPKFITKYRKHRIINRKIALKGNIPGYCQLEDIFFPIDISKEVEL